VERLFDAGGGAFVAWLGDEPAGSVRWLPVAHPLPSWEIKRMGVLPAMRGRGLGERLLSAVVDAARAAGVVRLQLGVRADQPRLIGFWIALGFSPDAQVTLSSHNPLTDPPVTMSRRLAPEPCHRP
jgi:GNAT superfamily N-acetyltransferase